jgi:hypothetical protein
VERTLAAVGQRDNSTPVKLAELFYGESCLESAYLIDSSELHHLLDPPVQGPDVLLETFAKTEKLGPEQRRDLEAVTSLPEPHPKIVLLVFRCQNDALSFASMQEDDEQALMVARCEAVDLQTSSHWLYVCVSLQPPFLQSKLFLHNWPHKQAGYHFQHVQRVSVAPKQAPRTQFLTAVIGTHHPF